jgi:hypothetical protein
MVGETVMMRCLIILVLIACLTSSAAAEVLVMTSGRVVVGKVISQTGRSVTVETEDGGRVTLPRSSVSSILQQSAFERPVETERWPNEPSATRQAMMDGTYQPSGAEILGSAIVRLKQDGHALRFLSSVPRYAPATITLADAAGVYRVSPPPPYVGPVYGYGYGYAYPYAYSYPYFGLSYGYGYRSHRWHCR